MTPSTPTSASFRRAAAAEAKRLLKQREKLIAQAARQESALAETRAKLRAVEQQVDDLAGLAGKEAVTAELVPGEPAAGPEGDGRELRGAQIREAAVQVARSFSRVGEPLHYRRWLTLLEQAGYTVAGQRPDAVFLNQLVRSPVVRSTTQAGYYELDPEAVDRLQAKLAGYHRELAELAGSFPDNPHERAIGTARQEDLGRDIRRTQRALDEALRSLGHDLGSERQAA